MLNLILFRHGKSDWEAGFANDHERPLADRGKDAAQLMGRFLSQTRQMPDLAVSSSALRARETMHLAARAGRWSSTMRIDSALYDTSATAILQWVNALEDRATCLLLTGHEPTWSDLTGRLIGRAAVKMPTAAMARVDFMCEDWSAVEFGSGELRWLVPPKVVGKIKGRKS